MNAQQFEFLRKVVSAAMAANVATGIPASITIAQAILESSSTTKGWGMSDLATQANNYFGIKAVHDEAYAEFPTVEYEHGVKEHVLAKFARYATPEDCFKAHAHLLSSLHRYAPAMACCHDAAKFAQALEDCGYSTAEDEHGNKIYAEMLMKLVRLYNLTQYDVEPPDSSAAKGVTSAS